MWYMTVLWKHLGFAYYPWASEISWDVSRCVSPFLSRLALGSLSLSLLAVFLQLGDFV